MDMQLGNGHAPLTGICTMDPDMQHGHGHAAWTSHLKLFCEQFHYFLTIFSRPRMVLKGNGKNG
jgi:hypothetical protein